MAGIFLVLTALGILMGSAMMIGSGRKLHPEMSRKIVHIGMGMITLSFPWLFRTDWPVITLGLLSVLILTSVKRLPWLKDKFGGVLGGVDRTSMGDIYFPVAVAALFVISHGHLILYTIPLLILTFGDATAALIGVRYGTYRYHGEDGLKSFEGSVAFFTVAFLCVHIPLLLFTTTGRLQCLMIAVTVGILAMMLEAIAWSGLDNLFLPIGGYLLLYTLMRLSIGALYGRLIAIVALVAFVIVWRRYTTLKDGALLAGALAGYVSWAIGGVHWLVAPLSVFIAYPLLTRRLDGDHRQHSMPSVISVVSVGLAWLFIAAPTHSMTVLLYPFTLSFAVQLALIGIVRRAHDQQGRPGFRDVASTICKSWAVLFVPYVFSASSPWGYYLQSAAALIFVTASAALFLATDAALGQQPTDHRLLFRQAGFASAASVLGLLVTIGGIPS